VSNDFLEKLLGQECGCDVPFIMIETQAESL